MDIKIYTNRSDEDLTVELNAEFCIPYEGSSEWLENLKKFIGEKAI
jgi:hypothetical protein